jgi:hypothetical protein
MKLTRRVVNDDTYYPTETRTLERVAAAISQSTLSSDARCDMISILRAEFAGYLWTVNSKGVVNVEA